MFVLADEPAEDAAASYPRCRQVGDRSWDDIVVVWWLQVPGPVRAMHVVVRDVLVQDCAQVPRPVISMRSVHSDRAVRTHLSA